MNPLVSAELAALRIEERARPEHSLADRRGHRAPRMATIFRQAPPRPGSGA